MARRCVTVGQLVRSLQKLNPNAVVVLQHDPEGNGYGPLDVRGVEVDVGTLSLNGSRFELDQDPKAEALLEKPGTETVVVLVPMG